EYSMFFKKKNQVIKFEQNLCNAKVDDNEILFVRVNDIVTSADARFEVPITHDAIVIKGGGDMRYYKSGMYDVFDNKSQIKNWKKGMSVEVIYIPKDTRVLIKWGTPNRLRYRDEASNKVITVGAHGEFDVTVTNPEQFFRKVVGVKKEFNLAEFRKRFSETVATEFADIFLKTVERKNLTYDKFTANKKAIGESMGEILNPIFERDWGLSVLNFKIADFDLHEGDMDAIESAASEKQKQEKLKEYLAELERLDDKQWEREKYLRQLELQDRAAYYEVLKVIGKREKSVVRETKTEYKCPDCGSEYKPGDKFCPRCGKRVSKEPIVCPNCGKTNESTATFCSNCGKKLTV
ncbi:MAG: SPFH domain-containing protein, partial [Clostridia bacterium]|nr:SPFH domain-containing protein [Clostridia bacterium]